MDWLWFGLGISVMVSLIAGVIIVVVSASRCGG